MATSKEKGDLGENFINELAFKSFLKYWCYPNPKDEKGNRKEICDLLILFKEVAIIICVKNYEFKGLYDRYFRKTIEKDVKQINGAERKILNQDIDTFIKHPDRDLERIDKQNIKSVFRIVVHLGDQVQFYPLLDLTKQGLFINIFDRDTFYTLVNELDTLPDFIDYLHKRENVFIETNAVLLPKEENEFDENTANQFFNYMDTISNVTEKKQILISGTEYDLLAIYLKNNRQFSSLLTAKQHDEIFLQIDGEWEKFKDNKQLLLKKKEDEISYFIDEFVKEQVLTKNNNDSIKLAKELMSFNRFDRRVISKSFLDFYKQSETLGVSINNRRFCEINGVGIIFVFYNSNMTNEIINRTLSLAMESFCVYSEYKIKKMILFATTNGLKQYKCGFMDNVVPFDKKTEEAIMFDAKSLGWFTQIEFIIRSEKEYPDEN